MVASLPASAASPKLKVAPKSKLSNGSVVTVSGKGFTAGGVYILECVVGETSTTGSGCNINNLVQATISSKGVLPPTQFTVKTGAIGTQGGTCGTTKANEADCAVSVGNASGGNAAQLTIKFAIPKS
jgi:Neocarzinostatin family